MMYKVGVLIIARPTLRAGSALSGTAADIVEARDYEPFGVSLLGSGGLGVSLWERSWTISDGTPFPCERALGGRVYGRHGQISVRGPVFSPGRGSASPPAQSGIGSVSLSIPSRRRSLFHGLSPAWTPPPTETEGAGIAALWEASTGIVDVTVKVSPCAPGYRIRGSGLYGPTGYWVTPDRSVLRIGVPVDLQWYAADFETDDVWFTVSANGVDIASGSMASGSIKTVRYTFPASGSYGVSVELRDANGIVATLQGPSIGVIDAPVLDGGFLTRSLRTRERSLVDIEFFVSSGCSWAIRDASTVVAAGQSSVASRLVFTWAPSIGTHELSLVLSDAYGSLDPISGPVITVVPWRDVISL